MALSEQVSGLIDGIYEAAFVPERWNDVLHRSAQEIHADGALLFSERGTHSRAFVSEGIRETVDRFNSAGWGERNVRAARLLAEYRNGFVTDRDLFSAEEIETEPMYADFLRPNGYGWGAATSVRLASSEYFIISYEKKFAAGPVGPADVRFLDFLRPHFLRAAFLSSRLSFERFSGALSALEMIGLPSALLSADARVLLANRPFESHACLLGIGSRDRLIFASPTATRLMQACLDAFKTGRYAPVQSIPVHLDPGSGRTAVLHISPLKGNAQDFFLGAVAMVVLTPVNHANQPAEGALQSLFDLSATEARVAQAILTGKDTALIAEEFSVSVHTVRTHVKRILEKTGMSRQAELVALLSRI